MANTADADLEGIDPDELFTYSDLEEFPANTDLKPSGASTSRGKATAPPADDAMDTTG